MGIMDFLKKKASKSVILIEEADFSSQNPMGRMIAMVEGGPGLIKSDGSVDMTNLVNILSQTRSDVPAAASRKDFFVWCGESGKKDTDPWATFYDLIKIKDLDLKTGRFGFAHEDFRKVKEGNSGVSFDAKVLSITKKLNYNWIG